MSKQKKKLGKRGEEEAVRYLRKNGYRILETNFRCRLGEIDIVAKEGEDIVFVEVRSRTSSLFGLPEETVSWTKQRKLLQLARVYLTAKRLEGKNFRFDVVGILLGEDGAVKRLTLYRNAFTE
ncbi:YraN family protein [Calderihabitans maritimus]|uniref:UPF0102 protein KKC1_20070 n=1 Tax=Calderihabitans maritimus TaxID=1246530 RepID=A0A1Z5HTK2_9FIRM|nr:YraN family protein [Calderihabitans maritimus]GAW92859.1 hypothetical protein Dtox_1218 [Calderihabitans maritimus]